MLDGADATSLVSMRKLVCRGACGGAEPIEGTAHARTVRCTAERLL